MEDLINLWRKVVYIYLLMSIWFSLMPITPIDVNKEFGNFALVFFHHMFSSMPKGKIVSMNLEDITLGDLVGLF